MIEEFVCLVEAYLDLHYKGPDGVSQYERNQGIARQKKNKGKPIPEMPEEVTPPWWFHYLWNAFWILNNSRRTKGIPEESIRTYQQNEGFKLAHWELEAIRRADAKAQTFWAQKEKEERDRARNKQKNIQHPVSRRFPTRRRR